MLKKQIDCRLKRMWTINAIIFMLFVIASILVDGNDCILGLNKTWSNIIASILFVGGVSVNIVLAIRSHKKGKLVALLIALFYVAMILPLIAWW